MSEPSKKIRCGVAGWSYPDWQGCVYTGRVKDQLAFLAGYVDMIEINSTFYRPPTAKNAASWVGRTSGRPDFFFTAKIHKDVTHKQAIDPEVVRAFEEGLRPMVAAGKLRHLLAQFRYDFADAARQRELLREVADRFGPIADLVLELRHVSWQAPEALEFLEGLGVTVANLDYPLARSSFNLRECRLGNNGYLRLHGRNAAAWFDKGAGRDATYDYLYSKKELEDIQERALSLARTYRSLTIVANNHFRGKEVANTLELKAMITGEKVAVPPGLLAEYPRLQEIALETG
jgi:uncharacterized protein YecE (DUF72 family)